MTEQRPEKSTILRVLLIEDSDRDAQRLLDALRGGGHVVYSRQPARRAEIEEALRAESWDVALLSCALPELPAVDAVELIGHLAPNLPVVLGVERGSKEWPVELLENGACDFVFKSNPTRLLAVVERECASLQAQRAEQLALVNPALLGDLDDGEARFFQLASNIPECYWLVDAASQRVTYVSPGYERIWGRYAAALYADPRDWLKYVYEEDRERLADEMNRHRLGGLDIRFRVQRPGDSLRWLHARNFPVRDEEGTVVSVGGVASDITGLVAEQWKIPYFAHFDALTALPNQLMFYDQARKQIALADRNGTSLALLVVDIDRFREINQALGQTLGDELLRQVAGRLSGTVRETDLLGRLGGDTFAILMPDVDSADQVGTVARRIGDALVSPVRVDGQEVVATASIGALFHPKDGGDAHELVSNAEIAVRHAKAQGRGSLQFYSPGLHDGLRDRLLLETDLRNALLRDEFTLFYQAKADCRSGRIAGAEALLRWQHPRRGTVPPDQFLPLLEESGLIVQVGRWVLATACRQTAEWQRAGLDLPSVSVNLSARELQSETLMDDVASALAASGLNARCLELELAEDMLMHDADAAIGTLRAVKDLGVGLALDDFGSGYFSLANLKRLPLDAVKVDRAFVRDIVADPDDASITRAVITMAHHLTLKVVAVGVETQAQLALLIANRCDAIQGYQFARPLPAAKFSQMLIAGKRLPPGAPQSPAGAPSVLFVAVDGKDAAMSALRETGCRVSAAPDFPTALQCLAEAPPDVLVCAEQAGESGLPGFLRQAALLQADGERIVLAAPPASGGGWLAELGRGDLVHWIVPQPLAPEQLQQLVEAALARRRRIGDLGSLSDDVERAGQALIRAEAERGRLAGENEALRREHKRGYRLLQEVANCLPWPLIGVDDAGMIVLLNQAALERFAGRGLSPGLTLVSRLPELAEVGDNAGLRIDGRSYVCHCRRVAFEEAGGGGLMLLEEGSE